MKTFIYYLRNTNHKNTHPFGCVAIGEENGIWCRGISICSDKDRFVKRIARAKAIGRVIKAFKRKATTEPILQEDTLDYLDVERINPPNKSSYNVVLTEKEKNIIS